MSENVPNHDTTPKELRDTVMWPQRLHSLHTTISAQHTMPCKGTAGQGMTHLGHVDSYLGLHILEPQSFSHAPLVFSSI
jgi:hypothetical protein